MTPAIIYQNIHLYQLFMRTLYGRHFEDRYRVVAEQIPIGTSVLDVCAGDAYLFTRYLKAKNPNYLAIDNSPFFLRSAEKRKINCLQANVLEDSLPQADVVVMMASLYQFIPNEREVIRKLISCAKIKMIISEPISNLTCSRIHFISRLAHRLSIPYQASRHYQGERFDRQRLEDLFLSDKELKEMKPIPGGRELMAIFIKS